MADSFLMATYSCVSVLSADITDPYVPLPISFLASYLAGKSNMIPPKSVLLKPLILLVNYTGLTCDTKSGYTI